LVIDLVAAEDLDSPGIAAWVGWNSGASTVGHRSWMAQTSTFLVEPA